MAWVVFPIHGMYNFTDVCVALHLHYLSWTTLQKKKEGGKERYFISCQETRDDFGRISCVTIQYSHSSSTYASTYSLCLKFCGTIFHLSRRAVTVTFVIGFLMEKTRDSESWAYCTVYSHGTEMLDYSTTTVHYTYGSCGCLYIPYVYEGRVLLFTAYLENVIYSLAGLFGPHFYARL